MAQGMIALTQIKEAAEMSKDDAKKGEEFAFQSNNIVDNVSNTIIEVNKNIKKTKIDFKANVDMILDAGVNSKHDLNSTTEILTVAKHIKKSIKYLKKILRKIELTIVQTTALSINGSVEAMRVGELGEGFSVVSNDIRNLAENSEQSLDQINDIVDNLEDETVSIIEAIEKMQIHGIKEAESLIVLASEMDFNTNEIETSVDIFDKVGTKLNEIDIALKESKVAAEQILIAADLSYTNSKESEVAAKHIQKVSSTMSENVSDLIEVAAQFKDA